ncbi:GlsB/YeaQ/YmgE family stress response membrane protein [Candidatus Venteria ishoeyi]|uniref:Transglycosylase associated protein n=1 Tax=Candidatus Venteria ishoeyi TaxID=1899563 RepID=A0A1H6FAX6_9GAMM|nr:GlsB/YeaQ/YmgE family stress response membrane protein [Candidatus Venteria ishoeyi]MDM8547144.1 GlsB/YeaQ/YmgE family stress response membrane protein [Candidatus Venteria ishoeyi]SEH06793.1 Transglycosylase associated protein [Candidatus Venteria ishoeyi]
MSMTNLFLFLVIGGVAGWLAGNIMKGGGYGLFINIILGIIGSIAGGFLFGLLGISFNGLIGSIVTATVGAIAILFAVGLFNKR